jgi:hypothetical protein
MILNGPWGVPPRWRHVAQQTHTSRPHAGPERRNAGTPNATTTAPNTRTRQKLRPSPIPCPVTVHQSMYYAPLPAQALSPVTPVRLECCSTRAYLRDESGVRLPCATVELGRACHRLLAGLRRSGRRGHRSSRAKGKGRQKGPSRKQCEAPLTPEGRPRKLAEQGKRAESTLAAGPRRGPRRVSIQVSVIMDGSVGTSTRRARVPAFGPDLCPSSSRA